LLLNASERGGVEMKLNIGITQVAMTLLLVMTVHAQEDLNDVRARARTYEPLIASVAARHNVEAELLWTIAYLESRFRPEAVSYKNGRPCAYGMMQFVYSTARRYGLSNPHNVPEALDASARYVRDLKKRFGGDRNLVLAAYNAGEGTVEAFRDGKVLVLSNGKIINPLGIRTGGVPPYKETRDYVVRGNRVYEKIRDSRLFQMQVDAGNLLTAQKSESITRSRERSEESNSVYVETRGESSLEASDRNKPRKAMNSIYIN
jgi:soluble lytic murein transglycosylase-like protein